MRKRADKDHEIIVKRRSKKGHGDEHGGAWKVAFADFTLAMMALFMVLWIVHPQTLEQPKAMGDQQTNPLVDGGVGVFDGASRTPLELDGLPAPLHREAPASPQPPEPVAEADPASANEALARRIQSSEELQQLARLIRDVSGTVDALTNIEVDVVPQGLRILIKDDQQRFMFQRGNASLDPHFRGLLAALAGVLGKVENKLIISGHTDATPYRRQSGYDNWNLSGDRALRARNVLVDNGLPPKNVLQVAAQADVMPIKPDQPEDGANRRIEILLLTERAESLYRELFGEGYAQAQVSASGARYQAPAKP
ncbi:OmpA family protein [Pseudomonas sp. Q1-7]|uniref:OmpA family protein n=1 Tax=Pseudomonas sp. Q1-7 TaxID=3020843 RepID=UPI0023012C12|nr:OmpA family protein [Pseudomonas sp. Q1-7]